MKSPKALAPSVTALAAVTALVLTACGPGDDAEFEDNGNGEETEQTSETEDTDDEDDAGPDDEQDAEDDDGHFGDDEDAEDEGSDEEDAEAGVSGEEIDPSDLQQTYTYSLPVDDEAEMTVGVYSITNQGETMLAQVVFVPEYDDSSEVLDFNELHDRATNLGNRHFDDPVIADRENLTSYYNLYEGSGNTKWSSALDANIPSGSPFMVYMYFPGLEDQVDTVDLAIGELGIPAFEDVPVEWDGDAPASDDDDADSDADDDADEDDADE